MTQTMTRGRLGSMEELLRELGATMRALRRAAGMSLRQVEAATGRGRGLLSQVENGRARPPRDVAEWYDAHLHGDGVVVSMLAEILGAHGPSRDGRSPASFAEPGDAMSIEAASPAFGARVEPGAELVAEWTLRNTGTVAWRERSAQRVGAIAGERLLASARAVVVAETLPGHAVTVRVPLTVPRLAGTFAAYWELVDRLGRRSFGRDSLLSAVLVADW